MLHNKQIIWNCAGKYTEEVLNIKLTTRLGEPKKFFFRNRKPMIPPLFSATTEN